MLSKKLIFDGDFLNNTILSLGLGEPKYDSFFFRNMWTLVRENHPSTLMSIKVGYGTQKVKKVKKKIKCHTGQ